MIIYYIYDPLLLVGGIMRLQRDAPWRRLSCFSLFSIRQYFLLTHVFCNICCCCCYWFWLAMRPLRIALLKLRARWDRWSRRVGSTSEPWARPPHAPPPSSAPRASRPIRTVRRRKVSWIHQMIYFSLAPPMTSSSPLLSSLQWRTCGKLLWPLKISSATASRWLVGWSSWPPGRWMSRSSEHVASLGEHLTQSTSHRTQSTSHRTQSTSHRTQSTSHRTQSTSIRTQSTSQNPEHLSQNPEHLYQNPEHLSQNPEHLYQNPDHLYQNPEHLYQNPEHLSRDPVTETQLEPLERFVLVNETISSLWMTS